VAGRRISFGTRRPARRSIRGARNQQTAELELYKAMVLLEQRIYGEPRPRWWQWRLPWRIKSLQEGFERERSGLVLVQALLALVVLFLVLARLVH
jgi:hypothetical protein